MVMKQLFLIEGREHGGGPVKMVWHPDGAYLATAGNNRVVRIYDRRGARVEDIPLDGPCISLAWTDDGDMLAAAASGTPVVVLWDSNSRKASKVDLSLKAERDLTFVAWSPGGNSLAAGTAKGNLVLYHRKTSKKDAILGKHTKRITTGAWSSDGRLALAADDKVISISNADGGTSNTFDLKGEPSQLQWAAVKSDARQKGDITVSTSVGERSLVLCDTRAENHVELQFEGQYGNIVRYQWFGDGYIIVGFASGQVVVISTHEQEIGKELLSSRFGTSLADVTASSAAQRAAIIADDTVRFVDLSEWKEAHEDRMDLPGVQRAAWSNDGRLLALATTAGEVGVYVARLPAAGASFFNRVVWRSSLREVCVADAESPSQALRIEVATEPSILATGPEHVAVAMNNRAWFYNSSGSLCAEREYVATIDSLCMNQSHVSVLSKGRLMLHAIDAEELDSEDTRTFPPAELDADITCAALTREFLIYGTAQGKIVHYSLAGSAVVNEFSHNQMIRSVFPNSAATRVVVVDQSTNAFVLNPVTDDAVGISAHNGTELVIWDQADWGVFVVCNRDVMTTCVYSPNGAEGAGVASIGSTRRPAGLVPLSSNGGTLLCAAPGQLRTMSLASHDALNGGDAKRRFIQCLQLHRLSAAWDVANVIGTQETWLQLANFALMQLDLAMAIKCYRMVGDAGNVMAIQRLESVEDRLALAGHVALLRGHPDKAQELFLRSPQAITALEMRMDLLQWDDALTLAKKLAPERVPSIAQKCAQQCEFRGDYGKALQMYQLGLDGAAGPHTTACKAGVIRMMLRTGDMRGVALAQRSDDIAVWRDCAAILEGIKQWQDAAALYDKAEMYEKAAAIYIQTKNWSAAAPLMPRISAPRLHGLYAKAKESEGQFKEAVVAYENARDWDAVVRLLLQQLHSPEKAFAIVRRTRSAEAAQLAALFCQGAGDYGAAIEFLLLARRGDDAFSLAATHDAMDRYAAALGPNGTAAEYTAVAAHFEDRAMNAKAGKFYAQAQQYHKALRLLLMCGENELDAAIEVVASSRSDQLQDQLIDYLMGEVDGVMKDQKWVFRLYMALGRFEEAATAAVGVAKGEMDLGSTGSYKNARDLLRDVMRDLTSHHIAVPAGLLRDLTLVHSYLLVKPLLTQGNQLSAARLLIRVCKHISRFPKHVVQILTSATVTCQRANLKRASYDFATILMQPEHRDQVDAKLRKPIERIVRHPEKGDDDDEPNAPCPYCAFPLPVYGLDCPGCKNTIPACVVSGQHMVLNDWTNCPACRMPALFSAFTAWLAVDKTCPMCENTLAAGSLTKVDDPTQQLRANKTETSS